MKNLLRERKIRCLLNLIVLCMMAVTMLWPKTFSHAMPRYIKVGFFKFPGYHMIDSRTKARSGYGYEYLQEIAKYTAWRYSYVGYNRTWGDMQKMLENGDIDILTSAQKTPEREAKFLFSAHPIGVSTTILTVKVGNEKYVTDDYHQYNGIRVGMLAGNSRNKNFEAFAHQHDFSFVPVYFNTMNELTEALQTGNGIDAILTSNLRDTKNEWVVAEFDPSSFYVMTRKDSPDIMAAVDRALNHLAVDYPNLNSQLSYKYYSAAGKEDIAFTVDERQYINDLKQQGKVFKAIVNADRAPISYVTDKNIAGIIPDLMQEIFNRAGIKVELVNARDRNAYNLLSEDKSIELKVDSRFDYYKAERDGYKLTDPYVSFGVSKLTLKGKSGEKVENVAAIRNSDITEKYVAGLKSAYIQYDSIEECVDAVERGKNDCAFFYTYTAQKIVHDDESNSLTASLMPEYRTEFAIAIASDQDPKLLSILNKTIRSLPSSTVDDIIIRHTTYSKRNFSLRGLFYENPSIFLLALGIIAAIIIYGIHSRYQSRSAQLRAERNAEFEQFIYNICKSNDRAVEFKLQTKELENYVIQDNQLVRNVEPFNIDKTFKNSMLPEDYEELKDKVTMEALEKLARTSGEEYFECRMKDYDQESYRWYAITLQGMLQDAAHPLNVIGLRKDIEEAKKEEALKRQTLKDALNAAQEASRAKGTFLSRISHEIRTPMNAIIGYITLAKMAEDNMTKINDCLDKSEIAAKHLLSLLNDVLDISSIESGKMKIAHESFDLKQLFTTIATLYYNQAQAKGVDFSITMDGLTEEWVIGDKLRLNQIMLNLLSNAVKFTPADGSIKVGVKQMSLRDKTVILRFTVQDTGSGMSQEFKERMFKPFEQESAVTAQKHGGTGLGLAITNNLVNLMHGTIEVESEEGKGALFSITIPFETSPDNEKMKRGEHNFSKLRALVVDDQQADRDYARALLKQCNIKCDIVGSGTEALQQLKRRQGSDFSYNLCFIDWKMSGMDGLETAKEIRKLFGKDMPIVIITAYDTSTIREAAEAVNAKVVAKPLFPSTMLDLLVTTYGRYHVDEENLAPKVDLTGMRILLAEDNAMNMEIAKEILCKAGLVVDEAHDGVEARDMFCASQPGTYGAILMDIQMPNMDGYEATEAIRASEHPEAKSIPIIAMTANAFNEDVSKALNLGMNAHISKPVNFQKLFDCLQAFKH